MKWQPFYTLLRREVYRFLRLFKQTIFPPVITTLLFILIFGYSLGSTIRQISGFDYIVFILPGLAQMGVINNAYQNTSTSLFLAKMEHSIENFIVAPLHYLQIVLGFILGGVLRGLTVGVAVLFISYFFVDFPMPHLGWLFVSWFLTSLVFSGLGMIAAILSEGWDQIATYGNFILMPLVYLGGTFYSIKQLPPFWAKLSYFNPIFYAVDSTRFAILGVSEIEWYHSFLILSLMGTIVVGICVWMFKRGYKIVN